MYEFYTNRLTSLTCIAVLADANLHHFLAGLILAAAAA